MVKDLDSLIWSADEALQQWLDALEGRLPSQEEALQVLRTASGHFWAQPTLVPVEVPAGATLHVVGDLHGQYCELKTVLRHCGLPSKSNLLLFNGDFVDRGARSVEVMLALLTLAVARPGCVFMNRGNHEFAQMNRHYGFEEEALQKYPRGVFNAFQDLFVALPLACVVNGSVFVTHGGLCRTRVLLQDIAGIDRTELGDVAHDLLWSDPTNEPGCRPSPRGAGVLFGPDVSEEFCKDNDLLCCIRSHEVKHLGYEWQRGNRCLTIFSAANYVGRAGNLGAVCHIKSRGGRIEAPDLSITTFEGEADVGHSSIFGAFSLPRSRL